MYVCPPVERSLLIFSLSRRQPTPPEGLTSTQTEAIIPLPLVCPMTTRGNPRDTHPLPFPVKSHQDGRSQIIYCDTGWIMVRAIRDRSRKKPRCSGTRRNLVKQRKKMRNRRYTSRAVPRSSDLNITCVIGKTTE